MAAKHVDPKVYIKALSKHISQARRLKLEKVANSRDDRVGVLLENVLDTGNENAVARTMEGLGFHRLYRIRNDPLLVERKRLNKLQRTDSGARKWLITHTSLDTGDCIDTIKRNGYHLACATPNAPKSIFDMDFNKKTIFVFGNETNGVSQAMRDATEIIFSLPMYGFVDSYNVSVAAAMTLFHVHRYFRRESHADHVMDNNHCQLYMLRYCILHLGHNKANDILKEHGLDPIPELMLLENLQL